MTTLNLDTDNKTGKTICTKKSTSLTFELCGTTNFNYSDSDTVKYGISDYYCLTDNTYDL